VLTLELGENSSIFPLFLFPPPPPPFFEERYSLGVEVRKKKELENQQRVCRVEGR
jgi:hypothetical protein